MKSIQLILTLLFFSFLSVSQAKSTEGSSSSLNSFSYVNPGAKESEKKESVKVSFKLVSSAEDFTDLGIAPEKLGIYISQIVNSFSQEFDKQSAVVEVALEITAIAPSEGKDCNDYTNCVMVKYVLQGDGMTAPQKVDSFGQKLMNIKEIEITNFQSKSKAELIIHIEN